MPERSTLGHLWNSIPSWLSPLLADALPRQFVAVCELCAPHNRMAAYCWTGLRAARTGRSATAAISMVCVKLVP